MSTTKFTSPVLGECVLETTDSNVKLSFKTPEEFSNLAVSTELGELAIAIKGKDPLVKVGCNTSRNPFWIVAGEVTRCCAQEIATLLMGLEEEIEMLRLGKKELIKVDTKLKEEKRKVDEAEQEEIEKIAHLFSIDGKIETYSELEADLENRLKEVREKISELVLSKNK